MRFPASTGVLERILLGYRETTVREDSYVMYVADCVHVCVPPVVKHVKMEQ